MLICMKEAHEMVEHRKKFFYALSCNKLFIRSVVAGIKFLILHLTPSVDSCSYHEYFKGMLHYKVTKFCIVDIIIIIRIY